MGQFIAGLFIGSMAGIFIMAMVKWPGDKGKTIFIYSDGSRKVKK